VPYAPGELKATAFDAKGVVLGTHVLTTTGKPAAIVLQPELAKPRASRGQIVYIPVEIRDSAGKRVDDAAIPLTAAMTGEAELLDFGSANPATDDFAGDANTSSWHGNALVVVRSTGKAGTVQVNVTSPGIPAAAAQFELK
jgi:beta-galactosidase